MVFSKKRSILSNKHNTNSTIIDTPYFCYICCVCVQHFYDLHFGWMLVISLYKEDYLQVLHMCSLIIRCGYCDGCVPVNRFNNTSGMTVVTPSDRPKSVRNLCEIEVLVAFLYCHVGFFYFTVGVGAFVIGLSHISSFFHIIFKDLMIMHRERYTKYKKMGVS